MNDEIEKFLLEHKFKKQKKTFNYFMYAIKLAIKDFDYYKIDLQKRLYTDIAVKFNDNPTNVANMMRRELNRVYGNNITRFLVYSMHYFKK